MLAGAAKLASPGSFAATLVAYAVLPVAAVRPLALTLPWLELLVGGYLLVGLFSRDAAWAAVALLAVFSAAISHAVLRGLSCKDCGCFGDVRAAVPVLSLVLGGSSAGSASPLAQDQKRSTSIADIQSFARSYHAHYPLLPDQALIGAQRYGVSGFPTLYLIDRQRVIRYANSGEVPEPLLADAITALLAAGSKARPWCRLAQDHLAASGLAAVAPPPFTCDTTTDRPRCQAC